MANCNPPVKGQAMDFVIALEDYANPGNFKSNPTLAAGDFKISIDDAAFTTDYITASVDPASSVSVQIELTTDGTNGDKIMVVGIDQTSPKEWSDFAICILTTSA